MNFSRNCEGVVRRDCLRLGLGTLFGGGLVDGLRLRGMAARKGGSTAPAKSCILIWMDGGPTHFETFDPKPDAPAEIRGEFDPIATAVPGVHFSQYMTQLATHLDKFSMVRSIRHNQGNHGAGNHYMMTGAPPRIPVSCGAFVSFHPSLGSVVSKELAQPGALPGYFSMPRMSRSGGPNFLGAKYAPFVVVDDPNKDAFRVRDVAVPGGLLGDRFSRRRNIRSQIDRIKRFNEEVAADPVVALDTYYRQGYDLVTSKEAQNAFNMDAEDEKVRDAYGRDSFGQRCLLARRLVEAGVPFITVYDGGWDSHSNLFTGMPKRLPKWDNSVSALITDLDQRGLLDETLVLALGEFGRTPKISTLPGSKTAGRDHWSNAMSVLMAGGRIPGGTVIGATDRKGYTAVENVLSPENFVSTVYWNLGIDPAKILHTPQGRPTHLVSDPSPIEELI